tara:strand:- start:17318 stop:17824 length:507 start_codon:yes stop_codon:yes gene_type:complete
MSTPDVFHITTPDGKEWFYFEGVWRVVVRCASCSDPIEKTANRSKFCASCREAYKQEQLAKYRPRWLEAFRLRGEGKTYAEIGLVLGVSADRAGDLVSKGQRAFFEDMVEANRQPTLNQARAKHGLRPLPDLRNSQQPHCPTFGALLYGTHCIGCDCPNNPQTGDENE